MKCFGKQGCLDAVTTLLLRVRMFADGGVAAYLLFSGPDFDGLLLVVVLIPSLF